MNESLVSNNLEWLKQFMAISKIISNDIKIIGYNYEKIYDELSKDYLENENFYITNSSDNITSQIIDIINRSFNSPIIGDPTSSNFILDGDTPFVEREEIDTDNLIMLMESTTPYSSEDIEDAKLFNHKVSSKDKNDVILKNNSRLLIKDYLQKIKPYQTDDKIIISDFIDIKLYEEILKNERLLKTMNWRTFEKLLADILESFGYKIDLMQGTKDGGIDIIAFGKDKIFGNEKYLIQAKRYKSKVGVEPVRSLLYNLNERKATKCCLATTSLFTKGAWDLKELHKWQLDLKDFDSIKTWLNTAYKIKTIGKPAHNTW